MGGDGVHLAVELLLVGGDAVHVAVVCTIASAMVLSDAFSASRHSTLCGDALQSAADRVLSLNGSRRCSSACR